MEMTKVTLPSAEKTLESLKAFAVDKDKRINVLFDELNEQTVKLEDTNKTVYERYEVVVNFEYLLVRLRFIVNDELKRIDYALTMSEDVSSILAIKSFFTKRKQYLIALTARLNEMREDLNVTQRSFYNLKF